MASIVATFVVIILGYYTCKYALKIIIDRLFIKKPTIVTYTTLPQSFIEYLIPKKRIPCPIKDTVYSKNIQEKLRKIINEIKYTQRQPKKQRYFFNLLLHGPPGTGKTLLAHVVSYESGIETIMVNTAALLKFEDKEALKELGQLIKYIKSSKRPVLVFFDEADVVFATRKGNSLMTKLTSLFLADFPEQGHSNYMIFFSTDREKELDAAIKGRVAKNRILHITPPEEAMRQQLFMKKIMIQAKDAELKVTLEARGYLATLALAQQTEGWVGRDIDAYARMVIKSLQIQGKKVITIASLEEALATFNKNK